MLKTNNLVPMSIEQLRMEHKHNTRHKRCLNLWFIDGLGEPYYLVESEIYKFGMDKKYPWYLKSNWGIKRINQTRTNA